MELKEEDARSRAKREQVLAGAQRVFLREGFSAVSTDTLAREAGVSKRTLYAYYPSKEELFVDAIRGLTLEQPETRVLAFIRSIRPDTVEELHEALVMLAKRIIAATMNPTYLALMRTIIADSHRFPQLIEVVRSTIPELALKEIGDVIQRAQDRGLTVPGDKEVMTRMYLGPLFSYPLLDGLLRPLSQPQPPEEQKLRQIVDLYIKAIAADESTRKAE
ncbi:TetR/AcrR family transcriptional regulator [Dictyobacter alpinus]|nr:TetR/AcrR family transcriptional regulator [Dictyobacter alpinus]